MSKSSWKPPKGVGVIYKGKGYRKKPNEEEESRDQERDEHEEHHDEEDED